MSGAGEDPGNGMVDLTGVLFDQFEDLRGGGAHFRGLPCLIHLLTNSGINNENKV